MFSDRVDQELARLAEVSNIYKGHKIAAGQHPKTGGFAPKIDGKVYDIGADSSEEALEMARSIIDGKMAGYKLADGEPPVTEGTESPAPKPKTPEEKSQSPKDAVNTEISEDSKVSADVVKAMGASHLGALIREWSVSVPGIKDKVNCKVYQDDRGTFRYITTLGSMSEEDGGYPSLQKAVSEAEKAAGALGQRGKAAGM